MGVELVGNLSFPVEVVVEVTSNFTTASGILIKLYDVLFSYDAYMHTLCILYIDEDFTADRLSLTYSDATVQFVNVSITDDQLVEQTKEIVLNLNPFIPQVIPLGSTLIRIFDNDGEMYT